MVATDSGVDIDGTLHSSNGAGIVRMTATFKTTPSELWLALTEPPRLAHWYGKVAGDLRPGGEFSATVSASGWDGRGRVDVCRPPTQLGLTMWVEEATKYAVTAELTALGDQTTLVVERHGVPLDMLWAFGAGWHVHMEDLASHVAGTSSADGPTKGDARMDELVPIYRAKLVSPWTPA